jgi:glycosyltransferase involved in cell wall biosynthesis
MPGRATSESILHSAEIDFGPARSRAITDSRPSVRGKFLFAGDRKLYLHGVTYGTFRPRTDGSPYPDPATIDADLRMMARNGVNAVRTYTVPPPDLLDAAARHGLWILIGLPWEQHVAFLEEPGMAHSIERRVRDGVGACAGHPSVLGYAIGNEIPAPIVRWHGRRRVERFLNRLYGAAKDEDPEALVTYVNFPSTEYLELPFLDFQCFNVYLESNRQLESYLARLQNLAGDRPLVMAEIGLDSRRHGEQLQAESVVAQVSLSFAAGCAGAFVFAWTDEWHRGGYEVEDWDFGLTDRRRRTKPALAAVGQAFRDVPFAPADWPRVSVVVCAHNGAKTIGWCLEGVRGLDYPDYEVIVVDDGSSDRTAEIAAECGYPPISTPNRGLSSARNTGLHAASGEIVAYLDCDARPDPHWLKYLAAAFLASDHAGIGGPNVPPPDGWVAGCVANAPGGPAHVLISDGEAEHIPGCNMAFRRQRLIEAGGFDPRFIAAGDDVDVCWRLQDRGETLGFSPGAVVWHRARDSVGAYRRQQIGYGRAEALLERKWPGKYNVGGHYSWVGRVYGNGAAAALLPRRWRVYYGRWGSALFQGMYESATPSLATLALLPEWYLVIALLIGVSALGALWTPLLAGAPLAVAAIGLLVGQAAANARRAARVIPARRRRLTSFLLTMGLHMLQPLARLWGRLGSGLTPWRRRGPGSLSLPRPRSWPLWSESWRSLESWVESFEEALREDGAVAMRGGDFDRWDLELRGGLLGGARILTAVEEHGRGRQLVRYGFRPRPAWGALLLVAVGVPTAIAAAVSGASAAAAVLGLVLVILIGVTALHSARAAGSTERAAARLIEAVRRNDQSAYEERASALREKVGDHPHEEIAEGSKA